MSHLLPIQVMKLNESILIFFLEISCSGSDVSLHWYHKDSIVNPALTADPVLTPYYPTADRSHSENIWLVLNAAKMYFDLEKKKKKKNQNFFQYVNHVFHISHLFLVWFS